MIYLFNSAYRPLYKTNILNTLYLPSGCINEYRYRTQHTDPVFSQEAKGLIFNKKSVKPHEEVAIVYIDRHATSGFVFHPIRQGKLESYHFENDQIYCRVRLLEYIYPKDLNKFQDVLQSIIGTDKLPRIKDNDPEITGNGFYVLQSKDILSPNNILSGEEAWINSVEAIAKTKAFTEPTIHKIIFLRVKLTYVRNNIPIKPSIKNDETTFGLKRNKDYDLKFIYRFPYQDNNPDAVSNMQACLGNDLIPNVVQIPIEGRNSRKLFSIKVKKCIQEFSGNISLNYSDSLRQDLLGPDSEIKYKIKESLCFWPVTLLLLVLFALCAVFISLDFSEFVKPQLASGVKMTYWKLFISIVTAQWFWLKFIAGFFQLVIIFILFKFTGKKFL